MFKIAIRAIFATVCGTATIGFAYLLIANGWDLLVGLAFMLTALATYLNVRDIWK